MRSLFTRKSNHAPEPATASLMRDAVDAMDRADTLRAAAEAPELALAKARGSLAAAFPAPETIASPVTALINVSNPNDLDDVPSFMIVTVDDAFIARLRHLQALCKTFDLDHASVVAWPTKWHHTDEVDDHRTELDRLVVTGDYFFYSAAPKHCDLTFESAWTDINELIDKAIHCSDPHLVLTEDVAEDDLAEIFGTDVARPAP